jgi:hypothetical protein
MKICILKLSNHDSKPLETKYAKFFCTLEMYIMSWEGTEECQKHQPVGREFKHTSLKQIICIPKYLFFETNKVGIPMCPRMTNQLIYAYYSHLHPSSSYNPSNIVIYSAT